MRRVSSQSLLGPALLLYLVADASAAQGELDSVGALTALIAGVLALSPTAAQRVAEVAGAQRVGLLGLSCACALVRVAAPRALSPVAELSHGVATALAAALVLDLALTIPDRFGGAQRVRLGRALVYAIAAITAAVGAIAYAPAFALLGTLVVAPAWAALLPAAYLGCALLLALAMRAQRRRMGSTPEALASNTWAMLGLVPGALVALTLPALAGFGVSPSASGLRAAIAACAAALIFGHVRLLDPSRRLAAGQATRNAVAAVLTLALISAGCMLLRPLWPEHPLTIAAAVAVVLLVALAVYRALCELARVLLAPSSGRLLLALDDAHDALADARDLLDVGRIALGAARRGAGSPEAEPFLYLIDPPRELRLDAAGVAHACERSGSPEIFRVLRERPGQILLRAPLEAQVVRAPLLRPLCDALRVVDALCVLPLSQYGELEGALVVPRGKRRSSLSLEEIEALHRFGRHLSGFVRVLASEARAEARAAQAFAASQNALAGLAQTDAELVRLSAELRALRGGGAPERLRPEVVAYSESTRALRKRLTSVAASAAQVLFVSERGLPLVPLAAQLHELSGRAGAPFLIGDCAGVRGEQAHAALLGTAGGALGWIQIAGPGTLLLTDVSALPHDAQRALATALKDGQAEPAGGGEPYPCRLRLCASCRRDPDALVAEGALVPELRALFQCVLRVPPLRERKEDLASLVLLALDHSARVLGRPAMGLEPAAQARLLDYDWPGNLEELHAVIELAASRSKGPRIVASDLPALGPGGVQQDDPLDGTLEAVERRVLQRAMERTGGNKSEAARLLGLKRTTFLDKLRRFGLDEQPGGKTRSTPPAMN